MTPIDASVEMPADALAGARAELLAGVNARMKTSLDGLTGKDDPASLAMRARLSTSLAQSMQDRAAFVDKAEGDKLRKSAKQMVVDTAPLAQRAFNQWPPSVAKVLRFVNYHGIERAARLLQPP